jgi:hypothetical protein
MRVRAVVAQPELRQGIAASWVAALAWFTITPIKQAEGTR